MILKGIIFSALKLVGCIIGISLLVPIEGPHILIPALVPKYGFPELMASFKSFIKSMIELSSSLNGITTETILLGINFSFNSGVSTSDIPYNI